MIHSAQFPSSWIWMNRIPCARTKRTSRTSRSEASWGGETFKHGYKVWRSYLFPCLKELLLPWFESHAQRLLLCTRLCVTRANLLCSCEFFLFSCFVTLVVLLSPRRILPLQILQVPAIFHALTRVHCGYFEVIFTSLCTLWWSLLHHLQSKQARCAKKKKKKGRKVSF